MIADKFNITLGEALGVTIFSMVLVFLTLFIISLLADLMKTIKNKKTKKNVDNVILEPNEVVTKKEENIEEDNTELVAVIAAAIASMTGKNVNSLVVKNIKRIPDSNSSWARTGRQELMR